ncbi:hypothetical protein HanXRQr2_Chr11g0489761 [Helianthus annuus]|uniref:Uncharacterized protein n=1 Tax=Helianthus annuus TaxID=4232 RepID=A0A9K3MZY2_HELAN|nr:hypothetical protein HanXRQr2_Chr11g0489761 [Helianthus annuus]KAJ0875086.1 hypothetical protein HanPSC8_Chr11g0472061 [Helianthus annuus]
MNYMISWFLHRSILFCFKPQRFHNIHTPSSKLTEYACVKTSTDNNLNRKKTKTGFKRDKPRVFLTKQSKP